MAAPPPRSTGLHVRARQVICVTRVRVRRHKTRTLHTAPASSSSGSGVGQAHHGGMGSDVGQAPAASVPYESGVDQAHHGGKGSGVGQAPAASEPYESGVGQARGKGGGYWAGRYWSGSRWESGVGQAPLNRSLSSPSGSSASSPIAVHPIFIASGSPACVIRCHLRYSVSPAALAFHPLHIVFPMHFGPEALALRRPRPLLVGKAAPAPGLLRPLAYLPLPPPCSKAHGGNALAPASLQAGAHALARPRLPGRAPLL